MEQLCNIHDEGKQEQGIGCLGLNVVENENTMDVFYMNEITLIQTLKMNHYKNN